MSKVVELSRVVKVYGKGELAVKALKGVDLEVSEGEFLCIMGPSGSGKTTLLNIIAALDKPTSGEVKVCGLNLAKLSEEKLARFRLRNIGIVFQFHNLLPDLTALDNVALPAIIATGDIKESRKRALELLEWLGLSSRAQHKPFQLSGGERQRVAVARAIVNKPRLLLCDEPTGSLDYESKLRVLELLKRINVEKKTAVIVVTHDELVAKYSTRVLRLVDGRILESI
ncbi:MAG: hypothetical protein DRJ52_05825 [Thermoprotei archaeon]|nr:MAG: hypothetical protein DRJ52_05825 [Thermoprotei archaeon]